MAVGLFGGSFNPPHEGHKLVAQIALRRLRLHQLWWMVTPGNPLKSHSELESLAARIRSSEALATDPRIHVTGFEAARGLTYTAETLAMVTARNPGVDFVWIMGADSLAGFHRWRNWQQIALTVPIAVIDRPGATLAPLSARFASTFAHARIDERRSVHLPRMKPPAWTVIYGPRSALSSTTLRRAASGDL